MNTTLIPTDKNGNVYYGPKTLKQARATIDSMDTTEGVFYDDPHHNDKEVCANLVRAGYVGIARRIAKVGGFAL